MCLVVAVAAAAKPKSAVVMAPTVPGQVITLWREGKIPKAQTLALEVATPRLRNTVLADDAGDLFRPLVPAGKIRNHYSTIGGIVQSRFYHHAFPVPIQDKLDIVEVTMYCTEEDTMPPPMKVWNAFILRLLQRIKFDMMWEKRKEAFWA